MALQDIADTLTERDALSHHHTTFAHPQGTFDHALGKYVGADGAPTVAQPEFLPLIALVWIQIVFVTMVYGPFAAFLVEFFPA